MLDHHNGLKVEHRLHQNLGLHLLENYTIPGLGNYYYNSRSIQSYNRHFVHPQVQE
jgi:hypothetical protein